MTVEQVLSLYPLSEGKLVAGKMGLHRIIRAVHVIRTSEFSGRVRPGDMLLVPVTALSGSQEEVARLVHMLHELGTAVIGVTGVTGGAGSFYHDASALVEEAERLQLPVIALPDAFHSEADLDGLLRSELGRQLITVQDVMEKQKKLLRLALRRERGGESHITDIAEIIGFPVAVLLQGGQIVFNSTSSSEAALRRHWERLPLGRWAGFEGIRVLRIALASGEETIGCVLFQSIGQTTKPEENMLYQAAELITHHVSQLQPDSSALLAPDDLGTLFVRYLQGGLPSQLLMERARKIGVMLCNGEYYCVLGVQGERCSGRGAVYMRAHHQGVDRSLSQEMMVHPSLMGLQIVHFSVDEDSVFVVPAETFHSVDKLAAVLRECMDSIRRKGGRLLRRISISYKKTAPNQLREAYVECRDAIRLSDRSADEEEVVTFSDKELAFLFEGVPRERMDRFCRAVLKKLTDEENENERELMRTLDMFLRYDAQIGEAAKQLYIHRNTAAYRLEKIGEMLEVDFKKTSDLLRMKLAFLFRHILKEEQPAD
ncbi:helix-turn-helix domain-containing protein [Paenibacillus xylaniclasticus]|uniref:helix-turn-helix domain-containing protein n=1 Tax=Paenibacillus xylaniclasticus TaxID=588083 RepID=UPI001FE625AD|nr:MULTISPECIES: helix-turn-helix domain-containing protein [Paenibacillus]